MPLNRTAVGVAVGGAGTYLGGECVATGQSAVTALAAEHDQFNLRDCAPATLRGRVMKLEASVQRTRLHRWARLGVGGGATRVAGAKYLHDRLAGGAMCRPQNAS